MAAKGRKRRNSMSTRWLENEQMDNVNSKSLKKGAERRIVLVGKTGAGKSSAGNTILDREVFKSKFSSKSVTLKCSRGSVNYENRKISVIDTPGMCGSETENALVKQIEDCVELAIPGPHAFLLVIKLGRITDEEKNAVKWIQKNFGEAASRYTIVLFTHADQLKGSSLEEFLKEDKELKKLIDSCGGRYHAFNNEIRSEKDQVRKLLEKIDQMVERNKGEHYTNEMFQKAQLKQEIAARRAAAERLAAAERERAAAERLAAAERERAAAERLAELERKRAAAERLAAAERERAELERKRAAAERLAAAERERAELERKRAAAERERAELERKRAAAERLAAAERERAELERKRAAAERERAAAERERAELERKRAAAERGLAAAERLAALERERAELERELAALERERAAAERGLAAVGVAGVAGVAGGVPGIAVAVAGVAAARVVYDVTKYFWK